MSDAPDPNAYRDVSRATYESWPYVNQSTLKEAARSCLARARYKQLHPEAPTSAQELGDHMHHAILEPRVFDENYAQLPDVDRRTNAGKAAWAKWEEENPGKIGLKSDDWILVRDMVRAVWEGPNTTARALLTAKGANELSCVWDDAQSGLRCKGRIDRFTSFEGGSVVVDVKTAIDASPDGFARAAARFGYHVQAAFYLDGLAALSPKQRRFLFLVVEKNPPYPVACYELGLPEIEEGRAQYREVLERWKFAEQNGLWPAYPLEIVPLSLPKWAFKLPTMEDVF